MISFRLNARPLEGGTRVAEGVNCREAVRVDRKSRPVDVTVGGAAAFGAELPRPIGPMMPLGTEGADPRSWPSHCAVAKAIAPDAALRGPTGNGATV